MCNYRLSKKADIDLLEIAIHKDKEFGKLSLINTATNLKSNDELIILFKFSFGRKVFSY